MGSGRTILCVLFRRYQKESLSPFSVPTAVNDDHKTLCREREGDLLAWGERDRRIYVLAAHEML